MDARAKPPTKRQLAREATRAKVVAAARALFSARSYDDVDIRSIAQEAGMSTGAIFASFDGKAALWRAAMASEPPVDGPLTRAAPALRDALQELLEVARLAAEDGVCDARASAAEAAAERALELAATPIGGVN